MSNPNNAVGTNGAFGGRTSVNAFNDDLSAYSAGIMSGWACSPSSGLTVVLGGDGSTRDVAVAEDNAGNKTTINNISGSPISVTVGNAPNNNSRIDSIVAYVDNPPQGSATATDNYEACGLIVVSGTVASTPVAPTDSAIRTAITADGASGTTAYYVVLANVTVASGTTDIVSDNIASGNVAEVTTKNLGLAGKTFAPQTLSTTKSVGNTWTDFDSYTIVESGLYFVRLTFGSGTAGSTEMRSEARNVLNGTTNFNVIGDWSTSNYAGNNFAEGNTEIIQWFNAGDIIKSQGRNQNWTGSLTVTMYIQQIY